MKFVQQVPKPPWELAICYYCYHYIIISLYRYIVASFFFAKIFIGCWSWFL